MKMLVGLGNPGGEFEKTRHNVGFLTLEKFFERMINDQLPMIKQSSSSKFQYKNNFNAEIAQFNEVLLVKPTTFMNRSGEAVKKIVDFFKLQATSDKPSAYANIFVIHDDLDIRLGEYKIVLGKGPKVHNGVNSVERALRTAEFWRVRVGVDNRNLEERHTIAGEKYVLSKFAESERIVIDNLLPVIVEDMVKRITTS